MIAPFAIRGAVEGFYGVFYTAPQRDELIRFLGAHGFTHYIYAPKNDRQHRMRWREPYPPAILEQFARTAALAREAGVAFAYALSPGASIGYSSEDDFAALTAKLRAFYDCGVRDFHLFLDDILREYHYAPDAVRYASYAEAHADLCNRAYAWLQALDPATTLGMCPTSYWGRTPFDDYTHTLGAALDPAIDVFYTGPEVCPATITRADAEAFGEAIRRPPLIWDNYPVNDGMMEAELHVGPLRGRDPALGEAVRGLVANLAIEPEAGKLPLATIGDYLRDPAGYDPAAAFERALWAVVEPESAAALRTVAENATLSCLGPAEAPLDRLATAAQAALQGDESPAESPAVEAFLAYLTELDEACYHLTYRMGNLALRQDLLPWIALLEHRVWVGRWTVEALAALRDGAPPNDTISRLRDRLAASRAHPKRIGGAAVEALADDVLQRMG